MYDIDKLDLILFVALSILVKNIALSKLNEIRLCNKNFWIDVVYAVISLVQSFVFPSTLQPIPQLKPKALKYL